MGKRWWYIIGGSAVLFVVVIGTLQWVKYHSFGYNGLDLAIYSQVVWALSHGQGFASSIHDPSYLGDHLELWLVPISWLYRLWSSPMLLLWLQTVLVVSSVVPLAKLTHRLLDAKAAVVATTLFLLHPIVYNVSLYEFHGLTLVMPLLFWSIWWYQEQRFWPWLAAVVAILLAREDMPLLVAGWGVMALIDRRSWKWWLPALLGAAIWFPAAQTIIRHASHDGTYKYLAFYAWLGSTPLEILTFPFRHPVLFITHVITFNNLGTIAGLASTVGFLCFVRPRRLWPLVLLGAQLLVGNAQPGSYLRIHYPAPLIPFIAWAALVAYQVYRAGQLWPRISPTILRLAIPLVAIIAPLYANIIFGPIEWPWKIRRDAGSPPAAMRAAFAQIQPTDRVLSSFAFLPQLANRPTLYSLNYLYLGRRQYSQIPYQLPSAIDAAIIDWHELYADQFLYRDTVFENQSGLQRIVRALSNNQLAPVAQYGQVVVYRRSAVPPTAPIAVTSPDPVTITTDSVLLHGHPLVTSSVSGVSGHRQLSLEAVWSAPQPERDQYTSLRLVIEQSGREVFRGAQVAGQGLWPASEWPANTAYRVISNFLIPSTIQGVGTARLELFIPHGRYRLDRWRQFNILTDREERLGNISLGQLSF